MSNQPSPETQNPPIPPPDDPDPPRDAAWTTRDRLLYRVLRGFDALVRRIRNQRGLSRLGGLFGEVVFRLTSSRRRQALDNLRLVYGDRLDARQRRQLARRSFHAFGTGFVEAFWEPTDHGIAWDEWVRLVGVEHLDAALAEGKGAILALPHMGNWVPAIRALERHGYRTCSLHRPAEIPALRRYLDEHAARLSIRYIATPLGTAGMRACLATLRRNELLLVVADRRSNDYQVEFLGHPAWTAHGVATFHLRSGAPIVPMICIRETTHHTIHFEPPIRHQTTGDRSRDTVALLGQINALFGGWIQRHPEQWLWQHDRWRGRHRNQRGGNSG
ncbi:MAG: lysophospholipid acyltransferase family protein [Pseudomonadota bacterium]|nr:lysophospholipid acyltransferase family protein [Pseudomonadota bacterium]